jgi:hypothetical protein
MHCEIPRQNPCEQSVYSLKHEEQEGRIGPVWERVKESKNGQCTLYAFMKIEQ